MKGKILIILSTVALLHIFVGALMLTNGCETADYDPMPPGAYVSAPTPGDPLPDNAVGTAGRTRTADPNVDIVLTHESDFVGPVSSSDSSAAVDTGKSEAVVKYKVQKGDTLSKIASMYGVTVAELASYNGISKTNFIKVGQVIEIPPGGRTTPRAATTSSSSAKSTSSKTVSTAAKSAVTPIPADGIYTVQKGDSFYKIGAKFGVKSADIAAYNNLTLEKPLQIGQKLNIPKPGASIPAAPAPVKNTTAPTGVKTNDLPKIDDLPDVAPVELSPAPAGDTGSSLLDAINDADTPAVSSSSTLIILQEYDLKVTETDMTLAEIAEVFGCELSELKKLNPQLPQTGKIRAGTPVKLP